MTSVISMNLTESARCGIHEAGMGWEDALAVARGLQRKNFYKSMTTHHASHLAGRVSRLLAREGTVCQVPEGW